MNDRPALGVFGIVGDGVRLCLRHAPLMIALAAAPWLLMWPVEWVTDHGPTRLLFRVLIWAVTVAALTLTAFRLHHGLQVNIREAYEAGIRNILPLVLCPAFAGVIIYFASIVIVPGIYLMGMWSVIVPAIVIENHSFGCLTRSQKLTEAYRWSLGGMWIVLTLVWAIVYVAPLVVLGEELGFGLETGTTVIAFYVMMTVFNIFGSAITAIAFARLLEIEQQVENKVAEVFN